MRPAVEVAHCWIEDPSALRGKAPRGTDGGLRQPWTRKAVGGRTTSTPQTSGYSTRSTGEYELRLDQSAGQSPVPGRADRHRRRVPAARRRAVRALRSGEARHAGEPLPRRSAAAGPRGAAGAARRPRPGRAGGRKRKPKKSRRKKALMWTGGVMAFVAGRRRGGRRTSTTSTSTATSTPSTSATRATRTASARTPINILIIGTDKRTGKGNEGYGDKGSVGPRRHHDPVPRLQGPDQRDRAEHPARPDHRHPGLPDQAGPDGSDEGHPGHARTSASTPASARTAATPAAPCDGQGVTGIKPDHFMMADFNAVKTLTTAVGGVEVCLAKDDQRPQVAPEAAAGQAHDPGRAGAGLRAHPAQLRQRERPRPDQAAAAVPRLDDPRDEVERHADQPEEAVRRWPRRPPRR